MFTCTQCGFPENIGIFLGNHFSSLKTFFSSWATFQSSNNGSQSTPKGTDFANNVSDPHRPILRGPTDSAANARTQESKKRHWWVNNHLLFQDCTSENAVQTNQNCMVAFRGVLSGSERGGMFPFNLRLKKHLTSRTTGPDLHSIVWRGRRGKLSAGDSIDKISGRPKSGPGAQMTSQMPLVNIYTHDSFPEINFSEIYCRGSFIQASALTESGPLRPRPIHHAGWPLFAILGSLNWRNAGGDFDVSYFDGIHKHLNTIKLPKAVEKKTRTDRAEGHSFVIKPVIDTESVCWSDKERGFESKKIKVIAFPL